jgi:hypothetical protein
MDVVAHLLAGIAEDRVGRARHRALHEIGQKAMELRARVLRARQAAAAEAHRGHLEVAPVLLDQQVGRDLRNAEERMRALVDRHLQVDAAEPAMVLGQLEPSGVLDERQRVGPVAIDLVGRGEDEGRVGRMGARGLQQVEGAGGVDGEVRVRLAGRPVVRRLRGGVDDDRRVAGVAGEEPMTPSASRMSKLGRPEAVDLVDELARHGRRRRLGAEEIRAHVVLDADDVESLLGEVTGGP